MTLELNFIKSKIKFILSNKFTIIFFFCLVPYSYNIAGHEGVSINYFFCLIPIFFFLVKKIFIPPIDLQIIILYYLLIFILHSILYPENFFRMFFSFIFFISIFSFIFLKISDRLIKNFKLSICLFTFIYFGIKFFTIFFLEGHEITFSYKSISLHLSKANYGSKYEGIVYLFTFWIFFFHTEKYLFGKLLKLFFFIFLILIIYLTYSKATLVTLFLSLIIFLINEFKKKPFYLFNIQKKNYIFFFAILFFITVMEINGDFYKVSFKEFIKFLYNFNINNFNAEDSTGYRIQILLELYNLPLKNILFGSGYLGVNSISEGFFGSTHNQYADIFLRTGFIGLFFYLLILYRILIFLKNYDLSLYYGFFSILIYSFFLETFRLSQGAFLLSFILGIYVQKTKRIF
jgi:O-antigen ligase